MEIRLRRCGIWLELHLSGCGAESADLVQLFVRVGDQLRLVAFRHIDPDHHPVLRSPATDF